MMTEENSKLSHMKPNKELAAYKEIKQTEHLKVAHNSEENIRSLGNSKEQLNEQFEKNQENISETIFKKATELCEQELVHKEQKNQLIDLEVIENITQERVERTDQKMNFDLWKESKLDFNGSKLDFNERKLNLNPIENNDETYCVNLNNKKIDEINLDLPDKDVYLHKENHSSADNHSEDSIQIIFVEDNKQKKKNDKEANERKDKNERSNRKKDNKGSNCDKLDRNDKISKDKLIKNDRRSEGIHLLKFKRIPYDVNIMDIERFLRGYRYKRNGIHIHRVDGKSTGVAYVEFENDADLVKAFDLDYCRIRPQDRKSVELYRADKEELKICLEDNNIDYVEFSKFLKVKGIPPCTKDDIRKFFEGIKIAQDGIIIPLDNKNRKTRDCYIEFASVEDAKKALAKDGGALITRYVRVVKSSKVQFKNQANLMLTKKLILGKDSLPKIQTKRPSIHKVKVYNNASSLNQSPINSNVQSSHSSKSSRTSKVNEIFPYYFDEKVNRDLLNEADLKRSASNLSLKSSESKRTRRSLSSSKNERSSRERRSRRSERSLRFSNSPSKSEKESSLKFKRNRWPYPLISKNQGYTFKSYYNTEETPSVNEKLKIVQVKNLPNNCTKEELFEIFDQIALLPKHIKIFIDRARRCTEAEIEFRTLEDAKKSFILSGASIRNRQIDVLIDPELKKVNIINPISTNKTNSSELFIASTNLSNSQHYFNNLYKNACSTSCISLAKHGNEKSGRDKENEYEDYNRSSGTNESEYTSGLSNSELINQLKNSLRSFGKKNYSSDD